MQFQEKLRQEPTIVFTHEQQESRTDTIWATKFINAMFKSNNSIKIPCWPTCGAYNFSSHILTPTFLLQYIQNLITYIQEFKSIYILHLRDKLQLFSHTCQFKLLRILYYSITEKFHYAWKAKDGMVHNGL